MNITIDTTDKTAMAIYRRAFPETNFRSITVKAFHGPMSLNSYWDSGYRDYFKIIAIDGNGAMREVEQNGTPFDGKNYELSALPAGHAVAVRHYAGQRQYGSLYLAEENITPMLPQGGDEMPWLEKAVLAITSGLKSAYRCEEARRMQITPAEWEGAKASLVAKKLLNAAGAITPDGRNLVRTLPGSNHDVLAKPEHGGRGYKAW